MLFKKRLLEFIRPKANSIFNIHNPMGIKYLTRLRLGFSHLKEHKFKPNSQDSVDPSAAVVLKQSQRNTFFSIALTLIYKEKYFLTNFELNTDVLTGNDDYIVKTLLLGKQDFDNATNKLLLEATIDFIIATERFDCPLL